MTTTTVRLTPTCVGRTSTVARSTARASAHPHVRGEDEYVVVDPSAASGSPPRAWGGLRGKGDVQLGARLTPTCVGRTKGPC